MNPSKALTRALIFSFATHVAAPAPAQGPEEIREPVRLSADGKLIDVAGGHAAPCLFDIDGDGVRDLLVGEYGDDRFPDSELPVCLEEGWKSGGRFYNGQLRIYKNHGTDSKPQFKGFEYLQAGGGIATVPTT